MNSTELDLTGASDRGVYTFTVWNCCGTQSCSFTLTKWTPPTTPLCPGDQSLCTTFKGTLALNGTLTGGGTNDPNCLLNYQWTGPNGFTGTMNSTELDLTAASDRGVYTFTVWNCCGTQSCSFTLTKWTPPTTPLCPGDQSLCTTFKGTLALNGTLTGGGTNDPNCVLNYQWTGPNGFTGSMNSTELDLTGASDGGVYTFTVWNCCSTQSCSFTLTKWTPPTTPLCPGDQSLCTTFIGTLALNGTLTGGGTNDPNCVLNYQWTGPNGFTGTMNSTELDLTAASDGGVYTFTVWNCCGTQSCSFTLTKWTPPTTPLCPGDQSLCNTFNGTLALNGTLTGGGTNDPNCVLNYQWTGN